MTEIINLAKKVSEVTEKANQLRTITTNLTVKAASELVEAAKGSAGNRSVDKILRVLGRAIDVLNGGNIFAAGSLDAEKESGESVRSRNDHNESQNNGPVMLRSHTFNRLLSAMPVGEKVPSHDLIREWSRYTKATSNRYVKIRIESFIEMGLLERDTNGYLSRSSREIRLLGEVKSPEALRDSDISSRESDIPSSEVVHSIKQIVARRINREKYEAIADSLSLNCEQVKKAFRSTYIAERASANNIGTILQRFAPCEQILYLMWKTDGIQPKDFIEHYREEALDYLHKYDQDVTVKSAAGVRLRGVQKTWLSLRANMSIEEIFSSNFRVNEHKEFPDDLVSHLLSSRLSSIRQSVINKMKVPKEPT
jgi:hypothetical protein